MTDRHWRDRAECLKEEPELFFPVGNGKPAKLQVEEAKRVCMGCAVKLECLKYAQENNIEYGVWGGLDEEERRRLGRKATRLSQG